jgi:hypothetical protein
MTRTFGTFPALFFRAISQRVVVMSSVVHGGYSLS